MYPIYKGTYERNDGRTSSWPEMTRAYRDWVIQQMQDLRRSIDYLESRLDTRRAAIAYYGFSWGGRLGSIALAQKPLFAHLGAPDDTKKHVIYPGGHEIIFQRRNELVGEILDWLDRYLGPAN